MFVSSSRIEILDGSFFNRVSSSRMRASPRIRYPVKRRSQREDLLIKKQSPPLAYVFPGRSLSANRYIGSGTATIMSVTQFIRVVHSIWVKYLRIVWEILLFSSSDAIGKNQGSIRLRCYSVGLSSFLISLITSRFFKVILRFFFKFQYEI